MAAQIPNSSPPILLISDLDDTIKISNTQSKLNTIYRGLFRSSAFAGMAELYNEMLSSNPDSKLHIVSSSPPSIRKKIEYFLKKNHFPDAQLTLRDWFRQPSIPKYKLNALSELAENSPYPVILLGDDCEHDPEVFAQIAKKIPDKILARYLRVVSGKALPEGSIGFFTAFDIACAELAASRLSNEQVLRVGESVLKAKNNSRLIPRFSLKPPLAHMPFVGAVDEALLQIWEKIRSKIQSMPKRKSKL